MASDASDRAIADTHKNLSWLIDKFPISNFQFPKNFQFPIINISNNTVTIFKSDVKELYAKITAGIIDAIITEPFLGQPIRGNEKPETIEKIISNLSALYLEAFKIFAQLLKPRGKIVIVIPEWHVGNKIRKMDIFTAISKLGFKRLDDGNLIYKRENQKVWRNITVWEKI
jgi:tRNA G10  N-methylase Trm11